MPRPLLRLCSKCCYLIYVIYERRPIGRIDQQASRGYSKTVGLTLRDFLAVFPEIVRNFNELFYTINQRFYLRLCQVDYSVCLLFVRLLQLIPMPVLYGVFLYMGFTALPGLQVSVYVNGKTPSVSLVSK